MTIRERLEQEEHRTLFKYAAFSDMSEGRDRPDTPDDIRTVYQRDRDRILHSKSFRRLEHKTQVFLAPYGDHYRTRLTHTLEVSQIARTIAVSLGLNEDLTEAIALGHDLGHTPFGHAGERALGRIMNDTVIDGVRQHFLHNEQSVRVVEVLEKDGQGLNLTREVRSGILNHGTGMHPSTLEGCIVQISDKIAYVNHDIDDGIRAGILSEEDLPREITDIAGRSKSERISFFIHDFIRHSEGKPFASLSPEATDLLYGLRSYMTDALYTKSIAKAEESKAEKMIQSLYEYYDSHTEALPPEYIAMIGSGTPKCIVVCDYIAGMTDNYAMHTFEDIYVPRAWEIM